MDPRQTGLMLEEILTILREEGLDRTSFLNDRSSKRITGRFEDESDVSTEYIGLVYATKENNKGNFMVIREGYAAIKDAEKTAMKKVVPLHQLLNHILEVSFFDDNGEEIAGIRFVEGRLVNANIGKQNYALEKAAASGQHIQQFIRETIEPYLKVMARGYLRDA